MSAQHTPRPKPLTQREQRTLDRLQIKWSKKTITAEEKAHALALSNRAWLAMKAAEGAANSEAESTGQNENLLIDVAALLAPFVEDGKPITRSEARDLLARVRNARATIAKATRSTS